VFHSDKPKILVVNDDAASLLALKELEKEQRKITKKTKEKMENKPGRKR